MRALALLLLILGTLEAVQGHDVLGASAVVGLVIGMLMLMPAAAVADLWGGRYMHHLLYALAMMGYLATMPHMLVMLAPWYDAVEPALGLILQIMVLILTPAAITAMPIWATGGYLWRAYRR